MCLCSSAGDLVNVPEICIAEKTAFLINVVGKLDIHTQKNKSWSLALTLKTHVQETLYLWKGYI